MMYTVEKANLISEQLRRFTTGYAHHVAGQFANIEFWLHEVQESIKTIDEYNKRFNNIRDEQKKWIDAHGTVVYDYCSICGEKCELSEGNGNPPPPVRASSNELKAVRKELIDSTYFFLLRCYRMRLLTKNMLEIKCEEIGTSIDPSDLEK
ncbi:MAG: hypothetical protein JWP81_4800 [Ferruginibacter sp.]|nr:hypothetical protein [Ferruginibacter sp.]